MCGCETRVGQFGRGGLVFLARLELRLHVITLQRVAEEGDFRGQAHRHEFAGGLRPNLVGAGHREITWHAHAHAVVLQMRDDELAGLPERGERCADLFRLRRLHALGVGANEDAFDRRVGPCRIDARERVE